MAEQKQATYLTERLRTIATYYQQGDVQLGFRRMMDVAIDTNNTPLFHEMIEHTDWLENTEASAEEHWTKAAVLLAKIEKAGVGTIKEIDSDILDAIDVQKSYKNGVFTLGPVNISLKRGALLGLVGENGNGKTTLLRILAQELRHDSGTVAYHFPKSNIQYDLRSQLAYIPQRTPKWHGSLKDNLKFTLASYGIKGDDNVARVLMIIARMGLWKYRALNWDQLSSGYKMRFELARTFLRCPDILLLDEPLANLDVLAQQLILEDLRSLANSLSQPMGVVLSSQQLYEVEKVSDKVLFLKNGTPMLQDNRTSVTADNSEIKEQKEAPQELIVEFDSEAGRDHLQAALGTLPLQKLSFNGGTYIAYFDEPTTMPQVLTALGNGNINVIYIRNISKSTRRYFVS